MSTDIDLRLVDVSVVVQRAGVALIRCQTFLESWRLSVARFGVHGSVMHLHTPIHQSWSSRPTKMKMKVAKKV
jgi:hypothetical protein